MKKEFNAWKEGARLYAPCLIIGAVLVGAFGSRLADGLGVALLVVGVAILLFFRDPPRESSAEENEAVAPADGVVVAIEDMESTPHYDGPTKRISIFLSLLDVHINRSPVAGVIRDVAYKPGEFKNAMRAETTDCNEANTVRMDTRFGPVTVRQIAGLVARRIVCVGEVGDELARGEKFGMIRFGSRTELYLPAGTAVCVKLKDKVYAGQTVVARF